MQASALGIKVRDHGGLYLDGRYIPVEGIRITYHEDPPPDVVAAHCPDRPDTTYYRRWTVQAKTAEGDLVYTGTREWPPAPVAPSMTYYHFRTRAPSGVRPSAAAATGSTSICKRNRP